MARPHPSVVTRTINRFRDAVRNYDELGAIPLYSDDPEEQAAIDQARSAIETEWTRAENALRRLINRERFTYPDCL